ncbi:MAG: hypothetical protein WAQ57_04485 [Candidatus Saccharimonadales bacterium]
MSDLSSIRFGQDKAVARNGASCIKILCASTADTNAVMGKKSWQGFRLCLKAGRDG